jgi:hypothetical protein
VLAINPVRPGRLYLGTATRQLLTSADRGATWTTVTEELGTAGRISAVAVDPTAPDTILVGIGMSRPTYAAVYAAGTIYRSDDAGQTWQLATDGLPPRDGLSTGLRREPDVVTFQPEHLDFTPTSPTTLFAVLYRGTGRPPYPDDRFSFLVYRSLDGGRSWTESPGIRPAPDSLVIAVGPA